LHRNTIQDCRVLKNTLSKSITIQKENERHRLNIPPRETETALEGKIYNSEQ